MNGRIVGKSCLLHRIQASFSRFNVTVNISRVSTVLELGLELGLGSPYQNGYEERYGLPYVYTALYILHILIPLNTS